MSWFGGGLTNLQGKITTLREVLNDVVESVQAEEDEREQNTPITSDTEDPNEELKFQLNQVQQKVSL